MSVCAVLATALLSVLAVALLAVQRQDRRLDERASAMQTLENLMEAATAGSWTAVDDERLARLELPKALLSRWPDAKLVGHVDISDDPVPAKRVTLTLTRADAPRPRIVTLTTWIFQAPATR